MITIYFGVFLAAALMLVGAYTFIVLNYKYPKSIGLLMGLSGGLLLGIIFFGILPETVEIMEEAFQQSALWVMMAAMVGGVLAIIIFERMLPVQHHHDLVSEEAEHQDHQRLVYIILGAFGFHSLFELLSILVTGSVDPLLAWLLILVIGLHNIPIGFVIVAQLEALGCSQKRCFFLIGLLALAEALLAVVCYLILMPFITPALQGILLGITGGIMLYLVFDELLPSIYKDGERHHVNYMIILGIFLMFFFIHLVGH